MCPGPAPGRKWLGYQGKKGRGERAYLICNQSPITACQQENRCERSFLDWCCLSKPGRLNSSQWINKPPAMLVPCIRSAVCDMILRRFFFKGLFFSQMSPISFSGLWIKAEFLFSSFGIILWFVKFNSIAGNFLQHLMNSSLEEIYIYHQSAESKKHFQVYI